VGLQTRATYFRSHPIKPNRDLQQTVNGKVNEIPLGLPSARLDFLQY
jgi:hypothetical protein